VRLWESVGWGQEHFPLQFWVAQLYNLCSACDVNVVAITLGKTNIRGPLKILVFFTRLHPGKLREFCRYHADLLYITARGPFFYLLSLMQETD